MDASIAQGHARRIVESAGALSEGHRARSSYARAYSGLADTYALLGSYDIMPISESHPLGRQAARKALELDDSLAEAHRSLAAIIADYYWDWGDVERHYTRAIALGPNDVTTLRFYSFHLAYTGRPVEALPMAEQACRLDPVSPNARMNLGAILFWPGGSMKPCGSSRRRLNWTRISASPMHCSDWRTEQWDARSRDRGSAEGTGAESSRPDIIALEGYILARAGRRERR